MIVSLKNGNKSLRNKPQKNFSKKLIRIFKNNLKNSKIDIFKSSNKFCKKMKNI